MLPGCGSALVAHQLGKLGLPTNRPVSTLHAVAQQGTQRTARTGRPCAAPANRAGSNLEKHHGLLKLVELPISLPADLHAALGNGGGAKGGKGGGGQPARGGGKADLSRTIFASKQERFPSAQPTTSTEVGPGSYSPAVGEAQAKERGHGGKNGAMSYPFSATDRRYRTGRQGPGPNDIYENDMPMPVDAD